MNSVARIFCLILLLANTHAVAQSFDDCKADMIFIRAEKNAVFNGSLQTYFEQALQNKTDSLRGRIMLTILIDTNGVACCRNIDNNTDKEISSLNLQSVISAMPAWQPAIQNTRKVNFSPIIILSFENSAVKVNFTNEKEMRPPGINKNRRKKNNN